MVCRSAPGGRGPGSNGERKKGTFGARLSRRGSLLVRRKLNPALVFTRTRRIDQGQIDNQDLGYGRIVGVPGRAWGEGTRISRMAQKRDIWCMPLPPRILAGQAKIAPGSGVHEVEISTTTEITNEALRRKLVGDIIWLFVLS